MKTSLVKTAVNRFKEGYSCSQAILMTYGKQYGMDETTAKTIARCFGGGMGRTCQTCGAVTGAFIVLGIKNNDANNQVAKEKTYAQVQEFTRNFKKKYGDVNCLQLLGCNLGTAEGQDHYKKNNLIQKCHDIVKDAAIILEHLNSSK